MSHPSTRAPPDSQRPLRTAVPRVVAVMLASIGLAAVAVFWLDGYR